MKCGNLSIVVEKRQNKQKMKQVPKKKLKKFLTQNKKYGILRKQHQ